MKAIARYLLAVSAALLAVGAMGSIHAQQGPAVPEAMASDRQYRHTAWTTEDGLPQNSINDIVQTQDGYLWLATFGGLVRFDGVAFTIFDVANAEGLATNRMTALYEDRGGILWIGHETGELTRYEEGVFISFAEADGLIGGTIHAFAEDPAGTLWMGTRKGLVRYKDGVFSMLTTQDGLPHNQVFALLIDREGHLWVGTADGVGRYADGQFTQYHRREGLPSTSIGMLAEDPNGLLWAGTEAGLVYHQAGRFIVATTPQILLRAVDSVGKDHEGRLWIATGARGSDVLLRLSTTLDTERGAQVEATAQLSINRQVKALFYDREGNLWAGTDGHGLHRFRPRHIQRYTVEDGLPFSNVFRVIGDGDGGLWISTSCNGLTRFRNGAFTTYPTLPDGGKFGCIWSMLRGRDGTVWLGSDNGLIQYREGDYTRYTMADGLPGETVLALFEDRDGALWVGTGGTGVVQFVENTMVLYTPAEGLVHGNVRFITQARDGALWFGTEQGVSRLKEGVFTNFTAADGLAPGMVRAIHEDTDGTLWIGTYGGGLSRYKEGRITRYTMADGLFDNVVSHILEDDRDNLWMLGNLGLFYVNRHQLNAFAEGRRTKIEGVSFGPEDGMAEGNGGGQPSGWKAADGRMWFPTIDGLAVIDAKNFRINDAVPPVVIERAIIDERDVALSGPITAPPGPRNVEIQYTGLSFALPQKMRFRYKLEEHDAAWNEAAARRVAYYTNLPPGDYTFRVQAANNDGIWNEEGATLAFTLKPFFYETPWFFALCLLVLGGLGYVALRVRTRNIHTHNIRLQAEILERKRAEEALQESEERYRRLVEFAPMPLSVVRMDGTICYANQAALSLLGASRFEEVIGTHVADYLSEQDKGTIQERMEKIAEGAQAEPIERTLVRRDGETRNVLISSLPIVYQGESAAQSVLIDISERKEAEELIKENKARLQALIENVRHYIWSIDTQYNLLTINSNLQQLYQDTLDIRLDIGDNIVEKTPLPEVAAFFKGLYDRAFHGEQFSAVLPSEDGDRTVYLEIFLNPIRSTDGTIRGVSAFAQDITERKEAEQALLKSEERFRLAFDQQFQFMAVLSPEGRVLEINNLPLQIQGAGRETYLGKYFWQAPAWSGLPEWQEIIKDQVMQAASMNGPLLTEDIYKAADGSVRYTAAAYSAIRDAEEELRFILVQATDITERKRAEEGLRASEEKFSKAFLTSPDAVIISALPDGEILDVNESFLQISGYSRDEVIGRTTIDLNVWVDLADRDRILETLYAEGRVRDYQCAFRTRSGEIRLCLDSAEVFELEGKKRLLSVVRDITERQRTAAEREELIAELEARNAELERFTYTVSHDLKTPLVTIKGFLGMLRKDVLRGNTARIEQDITQIGTAADRMARLLHELLDLSRVGRQTNPSEAVILADLVDEALELVAGQLSAHRIDIARESGALAVSGDRVRLLEVYQNLLDNAIRFMGEQPAPRIEIGAQQRGGDVLCWVRDNGAGIEARYHEKIFELFERLDSKGEGTGIGLALVRRIVEVHGGQIWVESEGEGQGTTFWFTLPQAEAHVQAVPDE